jgi:hypothetical protein
MTQMRVKYRDGKSNKNAKKALSPLPLPKQKKVSHLMI